MEIGAFLPAMGITLLFSGITSYFYYKTYSKRDVATSIVLYALFVFSIVYFVSFEDNIGLGIGLLGILSLIRLRSAVDSLVDIAFVFLSITLGLLNASVADLNAVFFVNAILVFVTLLLSSKILFTKKIVSMKVTFDDIDFEKMDDLRYLKKRVREAINVSPIFVRVSNVNYLKDSVTVRVTYELH